MEKSDICKLRELPIEAVAERLGLRVVRHKSLCPFHADRHPSLSFKHNGFRCFVCGAHGDTINLAMQVLHLPFVEACRWLADGSSILLEAWKPAVEPAAERPFEAARYQRFFDHPLLNEAARRFLFDERRLDPRVVRWCRLSSWRDKSGTDWLQIPYFDVNGRLVGLQSRNLSGTAPRFRFPSGSRCGMYNLPILKRLASGEPLYLTEGASDCWSLLSAGHKALAIPSATLLKPDDIEHLRGRNLHMYPDQDAPGEALFRQLLLAANQVGACLVCHSLPEGCKDYSDYYCQLKRNS